MRFADKVGLKEQGTGDRGRRNIEQLHTEPERDALNVSSPPFSSMA
jgi:hypothetical protein